MTVHYHWMARREIFEATEYYAAIRHSLGVEFGECLDAAAERIVNSPLQFEQFRRGLRRCPVDRFPYDVLYRPLDSGSIEIVVVKHHSRHPNYGMGRK